MRVFEFVVLTPSPLNDPSVAIAANRAGALGVLNLEFANDGVAARQAISELIRYTDKECGVRFDSSSTTFVKELLPAIPGQITVAILTCSDPKQWEDLVPVLHQHGLKIWLEVTNVSMAKYAEALDVDGLIAKGHESTGWIHEETTFILLQRIVASTVLPVLAYGGIGLHNVAACKVAGASGVVLDTQLALTRESSLPEPARETIAAMDGSETLCLGAEVGLQFRSYARPGSSVVQRLRALAVDLSQNGDMPENKQIAWHNALTAQVGWNSPDENLWPLGQDVAFAASLAQRYSTVGGVLEAMREALREHLDQAAASSPWAENTPLAKAHGCRYPIFQGPMTRVSDTAEFALRVAENGGLPFLALALMRGPDVETLLAETQRLLGDRPWGVGVLGFTPLALRQEQLQVIHKFRPACALIAGGRPDQAQELEASGIATYLHVPSPGLLRLYLQAGARRFIFEGLECGGHVGPRSSFVLWETAVEIISNEVPAADLKDCEVMFAGGIHDRVSAAMVATVAAPLAARGVCIGVLMGTAYLFTEEVVSSGAILQRFQQEALRCNTTVRLESGPGYETRCVSTPFVNTFNQEKLRLIREGKSPQDIREALEEFNVGRLRIAAKGIAHQSQPDHNSAGRKYVSVGEEVQHRDGLYMIGQVAALHNQPFSMAELHHEVAEESAALLRALADMESTPTTKAAQAPAQIAIVGMSAILPKAGDLQTYWENILNGVDGITEIPKERWDADLYYSTDRNARDKIYSRWGGFIDAVTFNPVEFGIPPNSLSSIDPMHLLALVATREALRDAGYQSRPFERSRTSVILGASGGTGDLGADYLLRSGLPLLFGDKGFDLAAGAGDALPEWTEDSFAGLLPNVSAGRIANRFDLGGVNFVVDAACASSLAAVHLAVRELVAGNSDIVITGGVDTAQNPFSYLCFSKTRALSPTGQPRVFDAEGDGIVISEGVAMLVLKRLADAERDGDRVYAVIQAVSGSSDGRAMGMTAPRPEGQMLALRRAYDDAGYDPTTVGLFEAHGTGTVVGDRTEAQSLARFLESHGAQPGRHAIGSVKSMIGHTKATAGVAGLAKVALSLYHKILPPTLRVSRPNPNVQFGKTPLYVNSEMRPWLRDLAGHPRRAGVSAFGFGGTNFHAAVEEYTGDFLAKKREAPSQQWSSELFLWRAASKQQLAEQLLVLMQGIDQGAQPRLLDLAYTLAKHAAEAPAPGQTLAIVAGSLPDLRQKLASAEIGLRQTGQDPIRLNAAQGIYFSDEPLARTGKVAFLFPGQGSQYVNMLRDLAVHFPEVRETFEQADQELAQRFPGRLSNIIFPPPAFTDQERQLQSDELTQTDRAQPSLGAAGAALLRLLETLGVKPEMVAGHSYGEYVALWAAEVIDFRTLATLSEARGRFIIEAAAGDLGTMAAVRAPADKIAPIIAAVDGVWVANLNAPTQTAISGTRDGIAEAVRRLEAAEITVRHLPVACGFHSPLVAPARDKLAEVLAQQQFKAAVVPVFSNTTAKPYPTEPEAIRALLSEHLVRPVRFADEIEAMYEAGARIFVEIGPRNVLSGLTALTLGDRPHLAIVTDFPGRAGLPSLLNALGQLAAQAVPVQLGRLFRGRGAHTLDLVRLAQNSGREKPSATTWLVDGARARPAGTPATAKGKPAIELPAASAAAPFAPPQPARNGQDPNPAMDQLIAPRLPASSTVERAASTGQPMTSAANENSADVMIQFQHLMSRFLETERNVMLAYLSGNGVAPQESQAKPETAQTAAPLSAVQAQATALPAPVTRGAESSMPVATERALTEQATTEPPASEPVAVSNSAAAPLAFDREGLSQHLLKIVSERTGYPPDMLDLDVDIEAKLGIDSIKRVEILGALRRSYLPADRQSDPEAMERLTGIKTLGGIIDWFERALQKSIVQASQDKEVFQGPLSPSETSRRLDASEYLSTESNKLGQAKKIAAGTTVPRSLVAIHPIPPVGSTTEVFPADRCIVITVDGFGVAEILATQIRGLGGRAVLVKAINNPTDTVPGAHCVDLDDPSRVAEFIQRLREEHGPIGGLVHLLPLREQQAMASMDLALWREQARRQVKSLFYLSRAAASDLKQAGKGGPAWLVAVSAMGGSFAMDPTGTHPFLPLQAGLAGLVKSLAQEWPSVRCKAIDVDLRNSPASFTAWVLAEMVANDGMVEVGYGAAGRQTLQPVATPLDEAGAQFLSIEQDWVILVTGGARGITAEVVCELAEHYQPTLLLVGSSPLPETEESPQTAGLTSPQELKLALMAQLRQAGEEVSLANVETAYGHLLRAREIRQNLARIERAGARIRYYQVDVRGQGALRTLIAGIYSEYGRLDGVIHGAGIIEDKLIEDKLPESFDRVFDTKADSAFALSQALQPESLRFLAFFSSAAGAFGNRGQADYAATNEVVNKLAMLLDRSWPGRVVSINWGPWLKTGMVSKELEQQFAARGIELISLAAGRKLFERELRLGRKGEVEVVLAGGTWGVPSPDGVTSHRDVGGGKLAKGYAAPLLVGAIFSSAEMGAVRVLRQLDLAHDLYLNDHRLDGKPVFPFAMAMELVSEVAQHGWPDLKVGSLRGLQVLRGIVLSNGKRPIEVFAKAATAPSPDWKGIDVHVEIADPDEPGKPFYRGIVELVDRLPLPPQRSLSRNGLQPFPMTIPEAYGRWLFHGPLFQGIANIHGISPELMVATCLPSSPGRCLTGETEGTWLIDPVVFDSALQLIILWMRTYQDATPLPSRFSRYRIFGPPSDAPVECYLRVPVQPLSPVVSLDIDFVGREGQLLGVLEGMECPSSKALNRLTGGTIRS